MSQNESSELQELRNKIKSYKDYEETKDKEKEKENFQIIKKKEYKIVNIRRNLNRNESSNINVKNELERLYIERDSLLNSGMYIEEDPLIIQIENRIRKLSEMEN